MKKMLDKLFAAMQDADGVPALEDSVTALLDQFADQRKQPRPVADKVIEDVALTQQVLKLANSPMYAPFATDVGSVSSAVKVLGDDAVMHLVLNAPVVSVADLHAQPSLSLTLHAAEIARALGGHRSEDASIATMMHNLGHLLVARLLPEEFDSIGQRIRAGEAQDAACRAVLGMTYQQVGKEVATRWNLPATIVSVIEGHGDPELQKLAELSNSAAILADQGQHEQAARLVAGAALPGADTEKLQAVLNRRKYEPVKAAASQHPSRSPSPSPLTELYLRLAEMEHDSCETLAGRMFLEVQQTLGTARALLLRPKESGEYRVSYAFGKGVDEIKAKLRLSAEFKPTAFHAAISKNADVSISDVSKLKPAALPEGYVRLLPKVKHFLILPVAHGKVGALIYFDWERVMEVRPEDLQTLRKLRDLFVPLLTK